MPPTVPNTPLSLEAKPRHGHQALLQALRAPSPPCEFLVPVHHKLLSHRGNKFLYHLPVERRFEIIQGMCSMPFATSNKKVASDNTVHILIKSK